MGTNPRKRHTDGQRQPDQAAAQNQTAVALCTRRLAVFDRNKSHDGYFITETNKKTFNVDVVLSRASA
jgi:hypothetical protein